MSEISLQNKIAKYSALVVLVLLPIIAHAGGIGTALLAFIVGLIGLFFYLKSPQKKFNKSPIFILLALFLTWLCVTSLWSPYQTDDLLTNYFKLLVMGLVFYFCPVVFKILTPSSALSVTRVFLTMTLLGALIIFIDIFSGYKITFFLTPALEAELLNNPSRNAKMNLDRALSLLVVLSAPLIILTKNQFKKWKVLSFLFLTGLVIGSHLNYLWTGSITIVAVLIAMLFAFRFPVFTPRLMILISGCSILFAPLLALISSQLMNTDLSSVPSSWEHRLRMWGYCWPEILNSPFIGNGFDVARTYTDTWITKTGVTLKIVSIHPHNAGIHIWLDAGLVGALLATACVFSLFRPVNRYAFSPDRSALISGVIMAVILISSLSYGAWKFWWWGAIFLVIGLIHLMPKKM